MTLLCIFELLIVHVIVSDHQTVSRDRVYGGHNAWAFEGKVRVVATIATNIDRLVTPGAGSRFPNVCEPSSRDCVPLVDNVHVPCG